MSTTGQLTLRSRTRRPYRWESALGQWRASAFGVKSSRLHAAAVVPLTLLSLALRRPNYRCFPGGLGSRGAERSEVDILLGQPIQQLQQRAGLVWYLNHFCSGLRAREMRR